MTLSHIRLQFLVSVHLGKVPDYISEAYGAFRSGHDGGGGEGEADG